MTQMSKFEIHVCRLKSMAIKILRILVAVALLLASTPLAANSAAHSEIVFFGRSASDEEYLSVYSVSSDGSNLKKLTNGFRDARDPSWSPNRKKIVFTAERPYLFDSLSFDLYVMERDGSNLVRITNNADEEWAPSWSPDGKRITFVKLVNGMPQIFVIDSDGTNEMQITNFEGPASSWQMDLHPKWSPNGQHIAFWRSPNSNKSLPSDIYIIDSDGRNLRQITNNGVFSFFPTWTPNGRELIFSLNGFSEVQLYSIRVDGSNQRKLLTSGTFKFQSSLSSNGKKIAFTGDTRTGVQGIFVSGLNGSSEMNVTSTLQAAYGPDWG